jgi:hypothetical protein
MSEMKYVVVASEQGEQLFTFPKNINHDDFADVLSHIKVGSASRWNRFFRQPISAGFTDGKACYGRSESLNLDCRNQDTALLLKGGMQ